MSLAEQTFEQWLAALREYHNSIGAPYGEDFVEASGADSWRMFYTDQYTPQEALEEIDSYD